MGVEKDWVKLPHFIPCTIKKNIVFCTYVFGVDKPTYFVSFCVETEMILKKENQ